MTKVKDLCVTSLKDALVLVLIEQISPFGVDDKNSND
jgi:hypothetical protein